MCAVSVRDCTSFVCLNTGSGTSKTSREDDQQLFSVFYGQVHRRRKRRDNDHGRLIRRHCRQTAVIVAVVLGGYRATRRAVGRTVPVQVTLGELDVSDGRIRKGGEWRPRCGSDTENAAKIFLSISIWIVNVSWDLLSFCFFWNTYRKFHFDVRKAESHYNLFCGFKQLVHWTRVTTINLNANYFLFILFLFFRVYLDKTYSGSVYT